MEKKSACPTSEYSYASLSRIRQIQEDAETRLNLTVSKSVADKIARDLDRLGFHSSTDLSNQKLLKWINDIRKFSNLPF